MTLIVSRHACPPPSSDPMLLILVFPSPFPYSVLCIQQVLSISRCSVRVCWAEVSSIFATSHRQPLDSHNGYSHFVFPPWPQRDLNQGISEKEQTHQTSPTWGQRFGEGRRGEKLALSSYPCSGRQGGRKGSQWGKFR